MKVSSSDLQRFVFMEEYSIVEQDSSTEPTPSKRLKSSSTNEENDEVRFNKGGEKLLSINEVYPISRIFYFFDILYLLKVYSPFLESSHLANQ